MAPEVPTPGWGRQPSIGLVVIGGNCAAAAEGTLPLTESVQLEGKQEALSELTNEFPPESSTAPSAFSPKNEEDYVAVIRGRRQVRTRKHEKLVRIAGLRLQEAGATVVTPHPIDLLMTEPLEIIFEAKTVRGGDARHAIRESIGQLYEYRHFLGPKDAGLCVLLDAKPSDTLIAYVEDSLEMLIAWVADEKLASGPRTRARIATL